MISFSILLLLWYDMIWYDMIWYDMIWYDMMWCEVKWGEVRWGEVRWGEVRWGEVIWYDMIWYDMIWYDMIWYDMIWYDMIWYDVMWCEMRWGAMKIQIFWSYRPFTYFNLTSFSSSHPLTPSNFIAQKTISWATSWETYVQKNRHSSPSCPDSTERKNNLAQVLSPSPPLPPPRPLLSCIYRSCLVQNERLLFSFADVGSYGET